MKVLLILLMVLSSTTVCAQDLISGDKLWLGFSLGKKVGKNFRLNLENLTSWNSEDGGFNFNQSNISLDYRLAKRLKLEIGYGQAQFRWSTFYQRYALPISRLNTISFHRMSLGIRQRFRITKRIRVQHGLETQFYIPRLEKYQIRIQYRFRLYAYKKSWPLSITPSLEPMLYYYQNGIPIIYRDNQNKIVAYDSSNGLHRFRCRFGLKFKPIKNFDWLRVLAYYAIQKEMNLLPIGNDLNVLQYQSPDSHSHEEQQVLYPFNDYDIFGLHLLINLN